MQRIPSKWAVLTALIFTLGAIPVLGGDGRIPIYEPTVIGADGNYYLTRDVTGAGIVIDIQPPAQRVVIDFSRYEVASTAGGTAIRGLNVGSITLTNGTIRTEVPSTLPTLDIQSTSSIATHGIVIEGSASFSITEEVDVKDLRVDSLSITGTASDHVTGSVDGVTIVDSNGIGLDIEYGSGLRVNDVSIENPGADGLRVNNCSGCQISNVAVEDAGAKGVNVESSAGCHFDEVLVIRSGGNAFFVDGTSQGNSFTHITGSFAQNGNVGFENNGSQTSLTRGRFHGCSGGGILNNGSEFSMWESMALGNAPPNFSDTGFMTRADGWTFY